MNGFFLYPLHEGRNDARKAAQPNVDKAVRLLCTAAGNGDLNAAKASIPWLNQALGMPTDASSPGCPARLEELERMDEKQLERRVAKGHERRLRAVPGPEAAPD